MIFLLICARILVTHCALSVVFGPRNSAYENKKACMPESHTFILLIECRPTRLLAHEAGADPGRVSRVSGHPPFA